MTIKLYGYARSRAVRNLWMLEEIGVPYEHVDMNVQNNATRTAEFLKLNPAGHIPVLDDHGVTVSESMAINLYLSKKHKVLYPGSAAGEAKALQWSFWVMHELDLQIVRWFSHASLLPMEQRDVPLAFAARNEMEWPLQVLERVCSEQQFLAEPKHFTVADLNVASVLYRLLFADLDAKPNLKRWLHAAWDRPAARKARAMRE